MSFLTQRVLFHFKFIAEEHNLPFRYIYPVPYIISAIYYIPGKIRVNTFQKSLPYGTKIILSHFPFVKQFVLNCEIPAFFLKDCKDEFVVKLTFCFQYLCCELAAYSIIRHLLAKIIIHLISTLMSLSDVTLNPSRLNLSQLLYCTFLI